MTTLGAIDLRDRLGHPVRELLTQPKRMALLTFLAVEGLRGPVTRDRLLALFWPEADEARARNALSQALYHLRQALGQDVIENRTTDTLAIRPETLWCDSIAFTEALARGEVELALDLYRGDFCRGLFASGTPDLEHWLDAQRLRLRQQALGAALERAESLARGGDREAAARAARRALALEPEDEADVRAMFTVLERTAGASAALLAYQDFARHLAATLETEPEPETRQLVEKIRARRERTPAAPIPVLPPSAPGAAARAAEAAPAPAPVPGGRWRPGHRVLLASATLVFVFGAIAGGLALRAKGAAPTPAPRAIAVLPFQLRGGTGHDYLRDGMVDLLSAKLSDLPGFQVIDPRSVVAAVNAVTAGAAADSGAARQLGAEWYITGEVTEVAGRLQLSGTLHDAGRAGLVVANATVVGDTAAVFELVDELAGRMLAGLTPGRDTTLTRLAARTTQSLPALKAYLDGEQALRAGREAEAAAAFRTAASIDTAFALAQYRLAMTATWVTVPGVPDPAKWATLAARHAERLSLLGRDLLDAYRAYKAVDMEQAERMYREITEGHPDNVEAWYMLAETKFHYNPLRGRSPAEAWAPFRRVLALDPTNLHALVHLARLAAWEGKVATLDSLTARYRAISPGASRDLEMRALSAYVHDDPKERAAVAAEAVTADDRVISSMLTAALLYAQNLGAARDLAPAVIRTMTDSLALMLSRRNLTELGLASGQWKGEERLQWLGPTLDPDWLLETEAYLAAEPLLGVQRGALTALHSRVTSRRPFPPQRRGLVPPDRIVGEVTQSYLLGLLEVRLGDVATAERRAAGLLAIRDTAYASMGRQLGHALRAELARSAGDPKRALTEIDQFGFGGWEPWAWNAAHSTVRERFLKAELLHAVGRDEEALGWYDSFQGPFDLPWVALCHLRRAQILERLGQHERAAFHASRFRAMWRDTDPEFRRLLDSLPASLR